MDLQIVEILHGYARASEYLELERMQLLAQMTPEESRAIFNDLVSFWMASTTRYAPSKELQEWRLENKLKVRRTFTRLAEANKPPGL